MIEGVLLIVIHVLHLFLELLLFLIIQDELIRVVIGIAVDVEVLILVQEGHKNAVVGNGLHTDITEVGETLLHGFHLKKNFLGIDGEFSDNLAETFLISEVVVSLVNFGDLAESLNHGA